MDTGYPGDQFWTGTHKYRVGIHMRARVKSHSTCQDPLRTGTQNPGCIHQHHGAHTNIMVRTPQHHGAHPEESSTDLPLTTRVTAPGHPWQPQALSLNFYKALSPPPVQPTYFQVLLRTTSTTSYPCTRATVSPGSQYDTEHLQVQHTIPGHYHRVAHNGQQYRYFHLTIMQHRVVIIKL